jgi:hypothetical protein
VTHLWRFRDGAHLPAVHPSDFGVNRAGGRRATYTKKSGEMNSPLRRRTRSKPSRWAHRAVPLQRSGRNSLQADSQKWLSHWEKRKAGASVEITGRDIARPTGEWTEEKRDSSHPQATGIHRLRFRVLGVSAKKRGRKKAVSLRSKRRARSDAESAWKWLCRFLASRQHLIMAHFLNVFYVRLD